MSQEYNSKLISQLYLGSRSTFDVIDEMGAIADPVFIEPLLDAYLRLGDTFCLFTLSYIASDEKIDILQDKLGDIRKYKEDVCAIIDLYNSSKAYLPPIIEVAQEVLMDFQGLEPEVFRKTWGHFSPYDLERILEYLKSGNVLDQYEPVLANIFFEQKLAKEYDRVVVKYLIRIDPTAQVERFIDKYETYKRSDKELVLSQELVIWKNGRIPELKRLIIQGGSSHAGEILRKEEEKNKRKAEEESNKVEQEQQAIFLNSQLVTDIFEVRRSINTKSSARDDYGFAILENTEILLRQSKAVNTESEFRDLCIDLRDIIKGVNPQVSNHGFSDEKALELIPGADNKTISGSLNQLYLFLSSRGVALDRDFWGLRGTLQLANLLAAHPNDTEDLIRLLKFHGLYVDYENKSWQNLHRALLQRYLDFLKKFDTTFGINAVTVNQLP